MKKIFMTFLVLSALFMPHLAAGEAVCLHPNLVTLEGGWEQEYQGRIIAIKVIVPTEAGLLMDYVDLAEGFTGGKYSALTIQEDGTIVAYEDYGDHVTKHILTIIDENTIRGIQRSYGEKATVSRYTMTRVED